jgi:hypothetical protein
MAMPEASDAPTSRLSSGASATDELTCRLAPAMASVAPSSSLGKA